MDQHCRDPYSKAFGKIKLAKHKFCEEGDYYVSVNDSFYKKIKDQCHEPFEALVIM